jgi:hypothetical protein
MNWRRRETGDLLRERGIGRQGLRAADDKAIDKEQFKDLLEKAT